MKPSPLLIVPGVIALILLTIAVAIGGMALSVALIPGDTPKEAKAGLIFLIPMLWVWKRFFVWCGLKFG